MDAKRFQDAYQKLQALDDRLTYKLRPRAARSFHRPTAEQLEERCHDLAEYAVGLQEVVAELFQAIASKSD